MMSWIKHTMIMRFTKEDVVVNGKNRVELQASGSALIKGS